MDIEDVDKVLELYESGKSSRVVAKELGISSTQVRRIITRFGTPRSLKTNDDLEKKIMQEYVSGKSSEEIAEINNLHPTTICRILKRNDLSIKGAKYFNKKYNINESFFDVLDSQEKTYCLGFMYSDGNVHSEQPSIKIEVHQKDIDIIEKIQDCLFIGNKSKIGTDRGVYKFITVRSEKIKNDLIKHGCVPDKTFKVKMPSLQDDLIPHFLRGFYDGDGCISIANNRVRVILTGFLDFLKEIEQIINTFKPQIKTDIRLVKDKKNVADLTIGKQFDCVEFLNWIYKDSKIHLSRKYNSYQDVLNLCAPDENYGSTNIISYKGQKLTNKTLLLMSIEEREEVARFLFRYFRQNGFPYENFDNIEMKKDFSNLCNYESKLDSDIITNIPYCGLKIFKHFFRHFYDVENPKMPSMVQAFNNDDLLLSVIRNRLGITYKEVFNITGNMIRQGIRNSYKGFAASSFKPGLAKIIYDQFAPKDSIVLDISAGFGQRMLGAIACKNVKKYIGIDPWDKQINSIMNVRDFLNIEDKVDLHQTGSESFCPNELVGTIDFCLSSPPFFNKEIYCNEPSQAYYGKSIQEFLDDWWVKTYNNVHQLLKSNSLFVLNMNKEIADEMICMCKDKFTHTDTKYVNYKRGHLGKDGFDCFYILRKMNL